MIATATVPFPPGALIILCGMCGQWASSPFFESLSHSSPHTFPGAGAHFLPEVV